MSYYESEIPKCDICGNPSFYGIKWDTGCICLDCIKEEERVFMSEDWKNSHNLVRLIGDDKKIPIDEALEKLNKFEEDLIYYYDNTTIDAMPRWWTGTYDADPYLPFPKTEKTFREKARNVMKKILDVLDSKRNDYGDSFERIWDMLGERSVLPRLFDKMFRLNSLLGKEKAANEPIEDTFKDIIGYCLLSILKLRDEI